MADPILFEITNGYFGMKLVDTAASGYSAAWQSPKGDVGSGTTLTPLLAVLADYNTASTGWSATGWSCQITSAALRSSPSTRTITRRATFCEAAADRPAGDQSTYSIETSFYQDPIVRNSLSLWLFQNDTLDAFVYFGMAGDSPPVVVGKVKVAAADIGGNAREPNEATVSFTFNSKPLIERPLV
jgi:hypothetical protein